MDSKEMNVQVEISKKDIFRLQIVEYKKNYFLIVLIELMLCGGICLASLISRGIIDSVSLSFPVVALLFPAFLFFLLHFRAKKMKKETATFNEPIRYKISDDSFSVETYHSNATLQWKDLYNYLEDNHTFFVYISSLQAYILPKRFFQNNEIPELREYLQRKITRKKKTGRKIFNIFLFIFFLWVTYTILFIK